MVCFAVYPNPIDLSFPERLSILHWCVCVCVCVCVSHLVCLTLYDPMDSSAHRILKERILEWISISFSPSTDVPCLKTPVLGVLRLISDSQGSSIA